MDWIKKNLWQTILVALITVLFSTGGNLYIYKVTKKNEKVDKSASVDYVDKRTDDLKVYIDVQDNDLKGRINALDNRMEQKADKYHVETIEKKIDVIYEYVLNQKK